MVLTLIISILTSILLITSVLYFPKINFKKIHISSYWVICLIGALIIILTSQVSLVTLKDTLFSDSKINPLKILILFFSMTFLSVYLDELNFFKFLATKASVLANKSQITLFIILYFLVSILTVFTSNDIVILTFTPFICYFCKNAKINPIPYLVSEFAAANTWSMMLIIGNPTNIYLATSSDITFMSYLKVMALPTVLSGLTELLIIYLLFRKKLKEPMEVTTQVAQINNIPNFIIGISSLGICLILLVISSYINIEMWIVSLGCAVSLLIAIIISNFIQKRDFSNIIRTFDRLPYELIPFMLSMFVIVTALKEQGVSNYISGLLGENHVILKYGITSFLSCNLINNIPMSVLYSTLPQMVDMNIKTNAIYATIIGSNIGAFLTPIGALAGIMFTSLINKYDVKYGFKEFIKYGSIISLPTLLVALGTLFLMSLI